MVHLHTHPTYVAQTFTDFLRSPEHHKSGYHVRNVELHGTTASFESGNFGYKFEIAGPVKDNYLGRIHKTREGSESEGKLVFKVSRGKHGRASKGYLSSYIGLLKDIIESDK